MSARPAHLKDEPGRRRPGLHLVKRKRRRLIKRSSGTRYAPIAVLGVICVCAVVFGVLLEQVVLAQSAFKLTQVNERLESARSKHESLLLSAAKLEAPGRIESYARTRLGMVDPPVVEYIVADVPRRMNARLAATSNGGGLPATGEAAAAAAEGDAP
jgi:cell division protein FtsB